MFLFGWIWPRLSWDGVGFPVRFRRGQGAFLGGSRAVPFDLPEMHHCRSNDETTVPRGPAFVGRPGRSGLPNLPLADSDSSREPETDQERLSGHTKMRQA